MPAAADSQMEILDAKLDTLVPADADSQGSSASQQSVSNLLREMEIATAVVSASAAAAAAISDAGSAAAAAAVANAGAADGDDDDDDDDGGARASPMAS